MAPHQNPEFVHGVSFPSYRPLIQQTFDNTGSPAGNAAPAQNVKPRATHYVNAKGKLRKRNPPAKERREFGLRKIVITEEELNTIRPLTLTVRQAVFAKDPTRVRARIWLTLTEIDMLSDFRKENGEKEIKLKASTLNDEEFLANAVFAERRRNFVEELKENGVSTRTKKARMDLHLTGSFMKEDDDGKMTVEDYKLLNPDFEY